MNQTLIADSTTFMPTIGQTPIAALKTTRITQATQVEHAEAQHPRLQQREDQQGAAAPAEEVEPVVGEPGHGGGYWPAPATTDGSVQAERERRLEVVLE